MNGIAGAEPHTRASEEKCDTMVDDIIGLMIIAASDFSIVGRLEDNLPRVRVMSARHARDRKATADS